MLKDIGFRVNKKLKSILLGLCILVFSINCFAWGFKGHVLIAEIAYNQLQPAAKKIANSYANIILEHVSKKARHQFNYYSSASNFAKVAILPDLWRKITIKQIFKRFHATIPRLFIPYKNNTIDSWHYINQPYPYTYCKTILKYNCVWAINLIKNAMVTTKKENSRAVLMVMLEHFVGDIHQPLHTITSTNFLCLDNDLGGNKYSVVLDHPYYHRVSLHKFWDGGAGYLKRRFNFKRRAYKIIRATPPSTFEKSRLNENNVSIWAAHGLLTAPFIYSVSRREKIPVKYYKKAQKIVKEKIALAGYRLANLLNKELT